MSVKNAGGSNERDARKKAAGRLSYLRNAVFELEGFGTHDRPTVEAAQEMHRRNLRRIAAQRPQPRVSA